MKRFFLLGDGTVFEGRALGAPGTTVGEVVFNTGMTGYQEILTDPSYAGQIVLLTYPLIGNYGTNGDDFESDRVQAVGLVVREACETPSNWRSSGTLDRFLAERAVVSIQGLDTRAIAKLLRSGGVTMGAICDDVDAGRAALAAARSYDDTDFVADVSTTAPYGWGPEGRESLDIDHPGRLRLAVLDCGLKFNILRRFWRAGCRPMVFPFATGAEELLSWKPDGLLLSPGPGDPARLAPAVGTVRDALGKLPVFGICLGNQLLCHAVGGATFKLKFGHRGSNHPVRDVRTGKVTITSQNHGYAVAPESLAGSGASVSQINVNDGTVEGIELPAARAAGVQYHPEAAPGPWDSRPYFAEFVATMAEGASA